MQRLLDAGALYVGKTNLDQFATGLNGTRTPYTVPRSVYGGDMISGGSSSGSALAVALGQVPFAVATDTAGSGRVPAALNGVVGFKPSRGLISTVGLVPACKSLDCISVMAGSIDDVDRVLDVMVGRDDDDAWSRDRGPRYDGAAIRVGLPPVDELEFFGDSVMRDAHLAFREHVARACTVVDVPLAPFLAAGALLYQGPWVAERLVEFADFLAANRTRSTRWCGRSCAAARSTPRSTHSPHCSGWPNSRPRWPGCGEHMDVLVVPTIGTTFTVDEVVAAPIDCNTMLGHYTHFGNLLDLLGVAIPLGNTADGRPLQRDAAGRGTDRRHRPAARRADCSTNRATPSFAPSHQPIVSEERV